MSSPDLSSLSRALREHGLWRTMLKGMLHLIERALAAGPPPPPAAANLRLDNGFPRAALADIHAGIASPWSPSGSAAGRADGRPATGGRLAVYSTFCGSARNRTFNSRPVAAGLPHLFFSNNEGVLAAAAQAGWIPWKLDFEVSENVILSAHQAKVVKALPHCFPALAGYDYLLYVDDKVEFAASRLEEFIGLLDASGAPMAMRQKLNPAPSPNVLHEFAEAMLQPRYRAQRAQTVAYISEQLAAGRRLDAERLYATGVILRRTAHPLAVPMNEAWYRHILTCGIECQVAIHFALQEVCPIATLPRHID
jgi:hypothetical protein